jgi:hypothetical protein
VRVEIVAEQALIVWDARARVQHFVRRATFETEAADFGFLVPSPARPELAEAPDSVFDALHAAIQPEVVRRTRWRLEPLILLLAPFLALRTAGAPPDDLVTARPPAVQVLERKRVAGYDAAVLSAGEATALLRWLEDHGYDSRPELREWLQPYVDPGWVITAFKVAAPGPGRAIDTRAVRMSFATERPFFPYREPADQREGPLTPRELLVYLVAPGRMEGTIGAGPWNRALEYAAPRPGLRGLLEVAVSRGAVADGAWLHAFRDRATPRPGLDDLWFAPSSRDETVVPPPVVIDEWVSVPVPLDVIAGGIAVAVWIRRRRRGRPRSLPAS